MNVTVLHLPHSKYGPYHLIYGLADWPLGTVRNRGWANAPTLYVRQGTAVDWDIARDAARYQCWRYREWAHLVADEARCGVDADACRRLWCGVPLIPEQVPVTAQPPEAHHA